MKKLLLVAFVVFMLVGCVTYKVKEGYIITKNGQKIEFNDSRVGWDSEGHGFEIWAKDYNLYIAKDDIMEIYFKR